MPIVIRSRDFSTVASLCPDSFDLPSQIPGLEDWLRANREKLTRQGWIVDIGFSVRREASGGGATLSPEAMRIMADLEMELWFSEYGEKPYEPEPWRSRWLRKLGFSK